MKSLWIPFILAEFSSNLGLFQSQELLFSWVTVFVEVRNFFFQAQGERVRKEDKNFKHLILHWEK